MTFQLKKSVLEVNNLTVGYSANSKSREDKILVEKVNFQICQGDLICVMGPNGCGKSTLLRVLAGLETHLDGVVTVADKEIEHYSQRELATKISVVLTDKLDLAHLTVGQVVALGRFPHTNFLGKLTSIDKSKIDEAIELLGLANLIKTKFNELSDGQKQKVLIARSLAQDPAILILDEPTTFLDISGKMEVLQILKRIALERRVAVIFSSHDWEMVLGMVKKVWAITQQKKITTGSPEDLLLNGEIEKLYISSSFDFDELKGTFKTKLLKSTKIKVEGKASKFLSWTIHALEKDGYEVYDNHSLRQEGITTPLLTVETGRWILKQKSSCNYFYSIEDLQSFMYSL